MNFVNIGQKAFKGGGVSPAIQQVAKTKPWPPMVNTTMKYTGGIIAFGLSVYGVYDNIKNYTSPRARTAIGVLTFCAAWGAGDAIGVASLPAVVAVSLIGIGGAIIKDAFWGETKEDRYNKNSMRILVA